MSRGGKVAARVVMLGFALLVSALMVELGVLIALGEQAKFPRHVVGAEFGVRVNEPGASYRHKSADGTFWFRINSRGLRSDRDFPYEKPEGVIRIVSLGDSFTAGYEVEHEETFSSVLEATLSESGHRVEVLNAGVSGYSNAEACLYLERELLRYDPDIVLLSFFANDLIDNVRTQLFELVDGRLEQTGERYVPAGKIGNFLNTNPVFNWLAGYSNAFVLIKEKLTHLTKRQMLKDNEDAIAHAARRRAGDPSKQSRELAAAILERIYATTRSRGIPFVIQSIPQPINAERTQLVDVFPVEEFDLQREGLYFLSGLEVLEPHVGVEALYNRRSHGHWTPFSHRESGQALARLVEREGLLNAADAAWAASGDGGLPR